MQAVILAAGVGTRLGQLTKKRSKAMLPILGVPMVRRVLDSLLENGVRKFVIVTRPTDELIRRYFQHCAIPQTEIHWVNQEQPLGMAHALACASPFIRGDFVLSSCDSLLPKEEVGKLLSAWKPRRGRVDAVLSLMQVPMDQITQMAIVRLDGRWVVEIVEKPAVTEAPSRIASLPLYCLPEKILTRLEEIPLSGRGEFELQDAIQSLLDDHARVLGVHVTGRLDLTEPVDLLTINRHFLQSLGAEFLRVPENFARENRFIPPCAIEAGVQLGPGCEIGPNVYMEAGVIVGPSAQVHESVLLTGAKIPRGAKIAYQVIGDT
jgi:bifunctional UDP-N-acetylglucosamine pyrophosphorylase/glucosamine-1-phosphate N-acetyltransferase